MITDSIDRDHPSERSDDVLQRSPSSQGVQYSESYITFALRESGVRRACGACASAWSAVQGVSSINPVHVEHVEFTPDSVHDNPHDRNAIQNPVLRPGIAAQARPREPRAAAAGRRPPALR